MKSKQGIESITVRRANIADADKVRYRVYSTATDFIAVIAESALMAVKVSGVKKPHKIVRDLPTEGIAIEAKKMAARDPEAARITLSTAKHDGGKRLITDLLSREQMVKDPLFRPMALGDLQRQGVVRARILPPEMLTEIIEEYTKATMTPAQPAVAAPVNPLPEAIVQPDAELSTKERIAQLANEALPGTKDVTAPGEEKVLSPEEVEKLLNG